MMVKSAQRVYSQAALEAWLPRVMEPWEAAFTGDVLDIGRRLYRSGEIRSMELTEDLAIISVKRGKAEAYAMVEWSDGPIFRSSTEDDAAGGALAVAGMYEIEELLADELEAVPSRKRKHKRLESNGGGSESSETVPAKQNNTGDPAPPPRLNGHAAVTRPDLPKRTLHVRLEVVAHGIRLLATWNEGEGTGPNAFVDSAADLRERERLIRLTGAARRAHFRYREGPRDYILDDLLKIPSFVNRDLPKWRALFRVSVGPGLMRLGEGVQEAKPEIQVEDTGTRMRVRIGFLLDGLSVSDDMAERLAISRGQTLVLPEMGLVRLAPEAQGPLETWLDSMGRRLEDELPRYMVFSFLGRAEIGVKLSASMEAWCREVEDAEDPLQGLPRLLRPYQKASVAWMRRLLRMGCHVLLADEMGLGKTLQILSLLDVMWDRRAPVMVVCPASVIPVWEMEVERHFPGIRTEVLRKDSVVGAGNADRLWLASYSQLRRRRKDLEPVSWAFLVLDEAQFIKNPDAKVTQACFALKATHRLAMTGTPVENRHLDLWTIFRFLMPGLLGSRRRLETALAASPETETQQVVRQISPFIMRRTKREVARELPDKVEVTLFCPLTDPQKKAYRQLAERGALAFSGGLSENLKVNRMGILSLLTRLRQICCDPSLVPSLHIEQGHSGKLQSLIPKLVEVVEAGSKVVIFSQFVGFLKRTRAAIETALPELPLFELTGRTRDRQAPVQAFQESRKGGIILVSLRAGGVGITLHSADYVFLMDPWWNPAVEAQAVDRVHRIGQKQTVFIYRMISQGTVEERMEELKTRKRAVFEELVGRPGEANWANLDGHFESLQALVEYQPPA